MKNKNIWDLIWYRAYADLKNEASRTYIGILWWAIDPIIQMAIFYFVFTSLRAAQGENFVQFLLVGIVMWRWFATTISFGCNGLVANRHLLLRVPIRRWTFPATYIASNTLKFSIVFIILIGFLIWSGMPVSMNYVWLVPLLLVELVFIFGVTLLTAAFVPLIPDLRNVVPHALQLGFFVSGIFFSIDNIPEAYRHYFEWNPMVVLLQMFRGVLMHDAAPDPLPLVVITVASLVVIWVAVVIMDRLSTLYAKLI